MIVGRKQGSQAGTKAGRKEGAKEGRIIFDVDLEFLQGAKVLRSFAIPPPSFFLAISLSPLSFSYLPFPPFFLAISLFPLSSSLSLRKVFDCLGWKPKISLRELFMITSWKSWERLSRTLQERNDLSSCPRDWRVRSFKKGIPQLLPILKEGHFDSESWFLHNV